MNTTIKQQAVTASIWSAIDVFVRQGMQFVITIVLARLLTPADYGTVGLLSIFIGLSGVFINAGFSSALIQRQEINEIDLSSVFYFNIGMAFIFNLLLVLSAPWIAAFYKMPVLIPLTRLMAICIFIGSFGNIQSVLLSKALDFRKQTIISLASTGISGFAAILLAWNNYGFWSLAISLLISNFVTTLLLWLFYSWRPRLIFSLTVIRSLFRYGGFLFISGLLDTFYTRLNTLFIGKFYSPEDLGFYTRADSTQQLPASFLSGVIGRVVFPIFSKINDDKNHLRIGLRKAITMVMMINIPIMLGISITARSLVPVLFGNQWLPCVPYLQILSLGGIFWPLHILNLNVLMAQGHANLFFRLELFKKFIGIVILILACFFGIIAIAWSVVFTSVICYGVNARYSGFFLNYGIKHQSLDLIPYFAVSLGMAICVKGVSYLPIYSPIVLFILQVMTGMLIYIFICYYLRLSAFIELIQLLGPRLRAANPFARNRE